MSPTKVPQRSFEPRREVAQIAVENLERFYAGVPAVRNVSLAVERGQILALLGPNGAGKTTILSMLSGNLAPHGGRIQIGGHDLLDEPRAAKRELGYLPESPPLYPDMTVAEYLRYCARLRGLDRAACDVAVDRVCERVAIGNERRRLLGHLSKGYRQRVGIAQAIVHSPHAVVLDEPTVGLDPIQIREMQNLICSLGRDAAVLVSTHLLDEASEIATHVAILHEGELVYQAAAEPESDEVVCLRVEFAAGPPPARLSALPGVSSVDCIGPGTFVIRATAGQDPREALLRAALAEAWGLVAMQSHRTSLEEVFLSIAAGAPGSRR